MLYLSHSISKLEALSRSLPSTVEEVEEVKDRYQTLVADTEATQQSITSSYETHNSLNQALSHVESGLSDLEEQVRNLSNEKSDTEQLNQSLQVSLIVCL